MNLRWLAVDRAVRLPLAAATCLLLAVCCSDPAAAAETVAARAEEVQHPAAEMNEKQRDELATAALFLMLLVLLAGGGLVLLVIVWGRSVRRAVRKPSPAAPPGDELWYLKPDKHDAAARLRSKQNQDRQTPAEPGAADET